MEMMMMEDKGDWIMQLEEFPYEILVDIFVRLPSQSISQLQLVSYKLFKLVDSEFFTTLNLLSPSAAAAEVPRLMVTIHGRHLDPVKSRSNTIQLLKYHPDTSSLDIINNVSETDAAPVKIFSCMYFEVTCVFRNLFCFADDVPGRQQTCFLFNPLPIARKGQVVMLPPVPVCSGPFSWFGMGLGVDAKTNTLKIKVVGISGDTGRGFAACIYELGRSSSWRPIPSFSSPYAPCKLTLGVSVFGNMFYWLTGMLGVPKYIISFDFNREEFVSTRLPDLIHARGQHHLLNFRGSLAVVNLHTPTKQVEICLLTDPTKEWTLVYKIERDVCLTGPGRGRLRHCGEWEHGLFFVEYHAKHGEFASNAVFLDLRCGGSFGRVLFPKKFTRLRSRLELAGRMFSFTGSTISLRRYANFLEAKEGECQILKPYSSM